MTAVIDNLRLWFYKADMTEAMSVRARADEQAVKMKLVCDRLNAHREANHLTSRIAAAYQERESSQP